MAKRRRPIKFTVPITSLPPETLLKIFEILIADERGDIESWYHITHVCHLWRQLAIETSAFWTRIPSDSDNNINWTLTALRRSKSAPIHKAFLVFTEWKMNLAVIRHIARIRSLYIELNEKELTEIGDMLECIGSEAPLLEELFIWAGEYDEPQFKLLPTHLTGTSRLTSLDLRWVDIDWSSSLLRQSNLTVLRLQDLTLESAPSWEELLTVLISMPALTDLTLTQALPQTQLRSNEALVQLPRLKSLNLDCNRASQAQSFLLLVAFPPLKTMSIGCDADSDSSYSDICRAIRRTATFEALSTSGPASSSLTIHVDHNKVIDNMGHLFVFKHYNDRTRSKQEIILHLAPSPDISTATIVQNVLADLHVSDTGISLDFDRTRRGSSTDPVALRETFGSIPLVHSIDVGEEAIKGLISALQIPADHHTGVPLPFADLTDLFLDEVDLSPGNKICRGLEKMMKQRSRYGANLPRLHLVHCRNLRVETVQRFADIGVDVVWNGRETDECGMSESE